MSQTALCSNFQSDQKLRLAENQCEIAIAMKSESHLAWKLLELNYNHARASEKLFELLYGKRSGTQVGRDEAAKALRIGDFDAYWRIILDRCLKSKRKRRSNSIAFCYAWIKDRVNTLKYLNLTLEESPNDLIYINPSLRFDFLRKDEEFLNIMKKVGLDGRK